MNGVWGSTDENGSWTGSIRALMDGVGAVVTHYNNVIMGAMASQITSLMIVYSTVYSGADQRKHQSSVPLAFVRGIHRWPVNSPHKGPVTRKMFPFVDVIMELRPKQNGRYFALYENPNILMQISLKFVGKGRIDSKPPLLLFQTTAWRRKGDKPLSETKCPSLLTHIYTPLDPMS